MVFYREIGIVNCLDISATLFRSTIFGNKLLLIRSKGLFFIDRSMERVNNLNHIFLKKQVEKNVNYNEKR